MHKVGECTIVRPGPPCTLIFARRIHSFLVCTVGCAPNLAVSCQTISISPPFNFVSHALQCASMKRQPELVQFTSSCAAMGHSLVYRVTSMVKDKFLLSVYAMLTGYIDNSKM